jgi:uncharacterized protein YcbX
MLAQATIDAMTNGPLTDLETIITARSEDMHNRRGRVTRLWRYPVKSMLGEECEHLDLNDRGAAGDRIFAVRDIDGKFGSGKTTRRFRKIDGLFSFRAAYHRDVPRIVFPDGRTIFGKDSHVHAALSEALGQPVTLAREADISHLDAGPLHLLTTASLAWLRALLPNASVDDRRFRPNILVDIPGATQVERLWRGKVLHIGKAVTLRVFDLTERCVMVNLSQADLPGDPRILPTVACKSVPYFGVYASVIVPGMVKRGDQVIVGN